MAWADFAGGLGPKLVVAALATPAATATYRATGVTNGRLLEGVRFFGGGHRTSTLFMSLQHKIIRFVDSIRRDDSDSPVLFQ